MRLQVNEKLTDVGTALSQSRCMFENRRGIMIVDALGKFKQQAEIDKA
jgi:hypothetical protein